MRKYPIVCESIIHIKESFAADLRDEGLGLVPCGGACVEDQDPVLDSGAVLIEDEGDRVAHIGVRLYGSGAGILIELVPERFIASRIACATSAAPR